MGSSNWSEVTGSTANVFRGVTASIGVPGGAMPGSFGTHVFGMRGLGAGGTFAWFRDEVGFAPVAANKGQRVTGAMMRRGGAGSTMIFACLQAPGEVTSVGYLLGLSNGDPSFIVLRKGRLDEGLPDSPPGTDGVLARTAVGTPLGAWVHLRLDVVINRRDFALFRGDAVLRCYQSTEPLNAPIWRELWPYVNDDKLGARTGSLPLAEGFLGYGAKLDAGAFAYFDRIGIERGA